MSLKGSGGNRGGRPRMKLKLGDTAGEDLLRMGLDANMTTYINGGQSQKMKGKFVEGTSHERKRNYNFRGKKKLSTMETCMKKSTRNHSKRLAKSTLASTPKKGLTAPTGEILKDTFSCDPGRLYRLLRSLTDEEGNDWKIMLLDRMGLLGLVGIPDVKIEPKLCYWLCSKFDPENHHLYIHGTEIQLRAEDVEKILGINDLSHLIWENNNENTPNIWKDYNLLSGSIPLQQLEVDLKRADIENDEFMVKFGIYAMGCFLCPQSTTLAYGSLLTFVGTTWDERPRKWTYEVIQFLSSGIRAMQAGITHQIHGCVYILMILYADNVMIGDVPPPRFSERYTRANAWQPEEFEKLMQRLHALGGVGSSKVRILMHHLGEEYSIIPPESQVKELHIKILNLESQLDSVVGELEMLSTLLVAHVLNRSVKHELLSLLGANQYQQMCLLKSHRLSNKKQMARGRVSTIRTALANLIPTLDELNASPFNENLLQVNIGSPQNPKTLVSGIGATFTPSSNSTTQTLKNVDIYQDSASEGIETTRGTCSRTPVSGVSVQVISGEEREGGQAHTKQHITRRLFGGVDVAPVVGPNATDQTLDPTIEQQTNNHYDTNLETPERLPFEKLPLLPRGLHLRFNPKSYMCLSKKELALAAFIFGSMKSTEDQLVYTTWIELRRGQFMSICPKNCILPEILAAWACMLTSNERATYAIQTRWYMPPFFSQRILDGCCSYYEAVSSYLYRFMGVWSACTKVFIPIKEGDNNWFLMIVDKFARKNWYVDSKPSDNMRQI